MQDENNSFHTINGHLNEFLVCPIAKRQKRLSISGLNAVLAFDGAGPQLTRSNRRLLRRFVVQVFHLKATYMAELGVGGTRRPLPQGEEGRRTLLERRLEKTAIRALYALQLEMGEVTLQAGEDGKFTVEQVTANPDYRTEEQAMLAAKAMWQTAEELWKHQGTAKKPPGGAPGDGPGISAL